MQKFLFTATFPYYVQVTKNAIIFNDYEIQESRMHHALENK